MILNNQDVVDAIFKKMDEMSLSEKNWIRKLEGNWDTVNRQLWECLVAFYLEDLGYQPKRFSQAKTNLDFGFSINEKSFYGECVCPVDGSNPDAFKPWTDDEYQPIEGGQLAGRSGTTRDSANQAGLRITTAVAGKQKQAEYFHAINGVAPTVVFLCTGLLNGDGIPTSTFHSFPMLSSTAAALYGVDGVPTMTYSKETGRMIGAVAKQNSELRRVSGSSINRMGFRDSSLNALSAVMNFHIHPMTAARQYLDGMSISSTFNESAELIANSKAASGIALDDIAIFSNDLQKIWIDKSRIVSRIVIEKQGQQCVISVDSPNAQSEKSVS